jgi:hypothetical protein
LPFLAQSASTAQLVLQPFAAASHAYGVHSIRAGIAHAPATQVEVGFRRSFPSHVAAPQTAPSATGQQVPSCPAIAHELHGAHAPVPQQNPSVQWPLMQSPLVVQLFPLDARFVHELPWQLKPGRQSVLAAQVVRQPFAAQV